MKGNQIGILEQGVQINRLGAARSKCGLGQMGVGGDDGIAQCPTAVCQGAGNVAKSNQSQRPSPLPLNGAQRFDVPAPGAGLICAAQGASGKGQNQGQAMILATSSMQ